RGGASRRRPRSCLKPCQRIGQRSRTMLEEFRAAVLAVGAAGLVEALLRSSVRPVIRLGGRGDLQAAGGTSRRRRQYLHLLGTAYVWPAANLVVADPCRKPIVSVRLARIVSQSRVDRSVGEIGHENSDGANARSA